MLPLKQRFRDSQIVIVTNFVVSSVGIKRIVCTIPKIWATLSGDLSKFHKQQTQKIQIWVYTVSPGTLWKRLFKCIENFTSKNRKFSDKKLYFFIFLLKT